MPLPIDGAPDLPGPAATAERCELSGAKLRSGFLNLISHDLCTSLSTLVLQAQLLERLHASAQAAPRITAILDGAQRMTAMTRLLVEVARFESGNSPLELRPLDLGALALEVLQRRPGLDPHAVSVHLEEGLPLVFGDRLRLERVFGELSGALDGPPSGAGSFLQVGRSSGHVCVCLGPRSDSGPGLYLCSLILSAHGGRLEEEALGGKRCFRVLLPISVP
ncbi:MAG: sensor histidine kinase [Myxococcaceae bacterium]